MITPELLDEAAVAATLVFKDCELSFDRLQQIAQAVLDALNNELREELNG